MPNIMIVMIHFSVIDVFSKYLHLIPIRTKRRPSVASAFRSIFHDRRHCPIWVRTDNGKELLNKHFQDMLRDEGMRFQVCRNPDLKCAVVEHVHHTIRDRLFKYFTYRNTYRYIDVMPKIVRIYNDTVHSTTSMAIQPCLPYGRGWKQPRGAFASRKQRRFGWGSSSHQQREYEICQHCRTEFQHRDFQGRQSNR